MTLAEQGLPARGDDGAKSQRGVAGGKTAQPRAPGVHGQALPSWSFPPGSVVLQRGWDNG